jgi:plasmid stability protein
MLQIASRKKEVICLSASAQGKDRVMIRLPDGMRPMLHERAKASHRSLNGEIVMLIERGLAAEKKTASEQA